MKKIYLVLRYLGSRAEVILARTRKEDADEIALNMQLEYDNNTGDHDTGVSYSAYRFAVEPAMLDQ